MHVNFWSIVVGRIGNTPVWFAELIKTHNGTDDYTGVGEYVDLGNFDSQQEATATAVAWAEKH